MPKSTHKSDTEIESKPKEEKKVYESKKKKSLFDLDEKKKANTKKKPKRKVKYIRKLTVVSKLPKELKNVKSQFKINIEDGYANVVTSATDSNSKQAIDFILKQIVFAKPVWTDKPVGSIKNPHIGALIGRWITKNIGLKKKKSMQSEKTEENGTNESDDNTEEKKEQKTKKKRKDFKTIVSFDDDIDSSVRLGMCLGTKSVFEESE